MTGDAVAVRASGSGCSLRLRVKPGARRSRLIGPHGGALKLEVAAAPEKGRANRAVERLLAAAFGVDRAAVRIAVGETSQDKIAEVAAPRETVVAGLASAGIDARPE